MRTIVCGPFVGRFADLDWQLFRAMLVLLSRIRSHVRLSPSRDRMTPF